MKQVIGSGFFPYIKGNLGITFLSSGDKMWGFGNCSMTWPKWLAELAAITWIRHQYMETPTVTAAIQVAFGGALVFIAGILIGNS